MNRRKFLRNVVGGAAGVGLAGAGAMAIRRSSGSSVTENRSVSYHVRGFSCVTCATGLEVMLREQEGVARVQASYPDAIVVIGFDDKLTSESTLKEFIASCGFSVG
jgi:Cu+-exporting ATPase